MTLNQSVFKTICRRRGLSVEATDRLCSCAGGDWMTALHRLALTRDTRIQQLNRQALVVR